MGDIARQIVPIGFGLLLTFAMLEGLLRVYFTFLGTEADRVAYVYSVDKILSISNRYEGQPYTNYGLSTAHPEHNSQGYRGIELQTPKADSTYRIMTLGGSTTYGEGLTPEESYPAQLQNSLHEDYGYTHIEVVNAGVNAYSSFDSLANLTYHILDDEPDMIIVYHGVNDVRARLVAPEFYTGRNEQRGYWNPTVLRQSLSPSVVIRFVSIQLGLIESPTQFETILGADGNIPRCGFFETTCTQVDNQSASIIIEQNQPIYFERNLVNMHAIATANDIDVIFSTWHYYADETELPNPMMLTHMQGAVDEQNNMIRLLGNQLDVPIINFASTTDLNSASYWQDGMHMTASGTRLQAEYYADFLIENDLLPPPPDNN
ncbi:MAG: GDSL-type esterase/lipase family protein [Chloroflexota bacterium]